MDMVQVSQVWKVFTAVLFGKGFVWLASRRIPLYYSPQAQIGASKGRRTCAMSMQLELPLTVICLTLRISLASQKWVLFLKLRPFVPLCRFPDSVRTASGAMRQHRARRRQNVGWESAVERMTGKSLEDGSKPRDISRIYCKLLYIYTYTSSARTSRGRKFPKRKELYSTERICL